MLYASFAVSLFSAFLAMLGKQWLNRYASTIHGTAIERSQNRQQKFNGIVTWYFQYVMESLPLMLQAALLLVGCAISWYLWGIDASAASVVISVMSFSIFLYFFTVVAGALSESCPYQTPGSSILCSVTSTIILATQSIVSGFRHAVRCSKTTHVLYAKVQQAEPWWSRGNVIAFLKEVPWKLPGALAFDTFQLLVGFGSQVYTWWASVPSTPGHGLDQESAFQDLQCISWTLNISLDKAIHLSTLESLATMETLANFDPTLVKDCFNILMGCVGVFDGTVMVTQGSEQLATVSAVCLLHTFSHLSVVNPTSCVLRSVHQCYNTVFPPNTNFKDFSFYHTLGAIHSVFYSDWNHPWLNWGDYKPSKHEHIIFACALAKLAQSEYQRREHDKMVPGWILRFVLYSMSLDPLPPTPVVIDCLSIIAIDLGCNTSSIRNATLDKRYVYTQWMLIPLTQI